jgi:ribonucleoside-diphosphate reductase alpha chain
MGFADLLFELEIPYDSEEALGLVDSIGCFIQKASWAASEGLAHARGPFPAWNRSVWDTGNGGRLMRNAQVTTIAPTGTISLLAGCSSGIEPVFSLAFTRQVLGGKRLVEVNPVFERALRQHISDDDAVSRIVERAAEQGSIQGLEEVPEDFRSVFRTARDVSPEWHVRMQAAWQRYTDAAVSKTVNLPLDASVQDVAQAYLLAYEFKCRGITVYRDGSRPLQPMALKEAAGEQKAKTKRSRRFVP